MPESSQQLLSLLDFEKTMLSDRRETLHASGVLSAKGLRVGRLRLLKLSHLGIRNEEFRETAIQANQKSREYPNGRRLEVLRAGKVNVKFRWKLALIFGSAG